MPSPIRNQPIAITGLGITSAIGQGRAAFIDALLNARSAFGFLRRDGRHFDDTRFLGAEINAISYPEAFAKSSLRGVSLSAKIALATLNEAWHDARLDDVEPARIGLLVAGSNLQQRELHLTRERYRDSPHFLTPSYAMAFMDTDIVGLCSQHFPVQGFSASLGGASASGQMAIVQGMQNINSGLVDACIVVAPVMDISYWECQGFRSIGAMGSNRFANEPELACRPFEQHRDGFIFGESCGVLVLEKAATTTRVPEYARVAGWGVAIDGNRKPNASVAGEVRAIATSLASAGISAKDIDYINPHGSGSVTGDEIEIQALLASGVTQAAINATKSIIGHGLSAAGLVEVIATVLQMNAGQLHPMRNFEQPINNDCNWLGSEPLTRKVNTALTLSMGFGGINSALCLSSSSAKR